MRGRRGDNPPSISWLLRLAATIACLYLLLSPALSSATPRGFCDTFNNCVKHPWQRSEVTFLGGYTAVREGHLWEHALTIGAIAQVPFALSGGDVTFVTQVALWSKTRIPEVNAHVGTIFIRAGVLVQQVGVTLGVKLNAVNDNVLVRPWSLGEFNSLQFFPSILLHWRTGWFGMELGLFDSPDTALGHIRFFVGNIGIGYSFPYGGDISARFSIGPKTVIEIRGFANWFEQRFSAGVLVGMLWGEGTIYKF